MRGPDTLLPRARVSVRGGSGTRMGPRGATALEARARSAANSARRSSDALRTHARARSPPCGGLGSKSAGTRIGGGGGDGRDSGEAGDVNGDGGRGGGGGKMP